VALGDFDNDGLNDLFFGNGMTRDFWNADLRAKVHEINKRTGGYAWTGYEPLKERNRLYRNRGGIHFLVPGPRIALAG